MRSRMQKHGTKKQETRRQEPETKKLLIRNMKHAKKKTVMIYTDCTCSYQSKLAAATGSYIITPENGNRIVHKASITEDGITPYEIELKALRASLNKLRNLCKWKKVDQIDFNIKIITEKALIIKGLKSKKNRKSYNKEQSAVWSDIDILSKKFNSITANRLT